MTERTPEQAALMAVIESYAEAKSSYQYACLEGCGDDEANAEADLATAFAAMEAIVCAPKAEPQWQPIATAPKNGKPVLLRVGNIIGSGAWQSSHPHSVFQEFMFHGATLPSGATHWMPLPKPPRK